MEDNHRFQRLLGILRRIGQQPGLSAQQLADEFGTSKRNLFRDIKLLQESGFEIRSDGGYSIEGGGIEPTRPGDDALEQGLNPWSASGSRPVELTIRVESRLREILRGAPLHDSQRIDGDRLYVTASPDRVADWLLAVEGAELLEPTWLRGSLQRRASQIADLYGR